MLPSFMSVINELIDPQFLSLFVGGGSKLEGLVIAWLDILPPVHIVSVCKFNLFIISRLVKKIEIVIVMILSPQIIRLH